MRQWRGSRCASTPDLAALIQCFDQFSDLGSPICGGMGVGGLFAQFLRQIRVGQASPMKGARQSEKGGMAVAARSQSPISHSILDDVGGLGDSFRLEFQAQFTQLITHDARRIKRLRRGHGHGFRFRVGAKTCDAVGKPTLDVQRTA